DGVPAHRRLRRTGVQRPHGQQADSVDRRTHGGNRARPTQVPVRATGIARPRRWPCDGPLVVYSVCARLSSSVMTSSQAPGSDDTSVVGRRWRRSVSPLPTVSAADQHDLVWDEFVGQFRWFDRSATAARVKYQVLKIMALALGASVTVLAAIGAPAG